MLPLVTPGTAAARLLGVELLAGRHDENENGGQRHEHDQAPSTGTGRPGSPGTGSGLVRAGTSPGSSARGGGSRSGNRPTALPVGPQPSEVLVVLVPVVGAMPALSSWSPRAWGTSIVQSCAAS